MKKMYTYQSYTKLQRAQDLILRRIGEKQVAGNQAIGPGISSIVTDPLIDDIGSRQYSVWTAAADGSPREPQIMLHQIRWHHVLGLCDRVQPNERINL